MKQRIRALLACLVSLCCVTPAEADVRLQMDRVMNGSAPGSNPPWLTATFLTLFPGKVELSLQANLDNASEFISQIALNLDPSISPTALTFAQLGGPAYESIGRSTTGNSESLPGAGAGGGGCDILIAWPTGGGSALRFDKTDLVQLSITGPETLVAENFLFFNTPGGNPGQLMLGAHVQGIPAGGGATTSGAILQSIPEPTPMVLLLTGCAAWFIRRFKS